MDKSLRALKRMREILSARVYDVSIETPLSYLISLGRELDVRCYLKREDLQPTNSFKCRGAYNAVLQAHKSGVKEITTSSTGNFCIAASLACNTLGITHVACLPANTHSYTLNTIRENGTKVILVGANRQEAREYALNVRRGEFLCQFTNKDVVAGYGTIAAELMLQEPEIDYVFVPVGSGCLLRGVAPYLKEVNPSIKVIAVEPDKQAYIRAFLVGGGEMKKPPANLFTKSLEIGDVDIESLIEIEAYVDDFITVSNDQISSSILDICESLGVLVEPAGAVSLAGLKKYSIANKISGERLVALSTGSNRDAVRDTLNPFDVFTSMKSTFISYGGPDKEFARALSHALKLEGVKTYFYEDDQVPGEKLHRVMRDTLEKHDKVILVCSERSLSRSGILNELENTLSKEGRLGGEEILIPISIDDFVYDKWSPNNPNIARAIKDRSICSFEHVPLDEIASSESFRKLLKALR